MTSQTVAAATFRERLTVPRWWHLLSPVFGILIGGEAVLTNHTVVAIATIVGFMVLAELAWWSLGRRLVEVRAAKVRAGTWRLPVAQIRGVAVLGADQMRAEQRRADPHVYRCTAPWISVGLLLEVDDPDDMPRWLVSTRDPQGLAEALAAEAFTPAPAG